MAEKILETLANGCGGGQDEDQMETRGDVKREDVTEFSMQSCEMSYLLHRANLSNQILPHGKVRKSRQI